MRPRNAEPRATASARRRTAAAPPTAAPRRLAGKSHSTPAPAFTKKRIDDLRDGVRTVLVRVDFNVPLDGRRITDDTRIAAALPTIRRLLGRQLRVVLLSHLGRPGGQRAANLSLRPVAARLSEMLDLQVGFCADTIGPRAHRAVAEALDGVVLLENTRFYPEEERNDPAFARALATLADAFVNDAFGSAHRAHASTAGVAAYLPGVAGLLMEREVLALSRLLHPEPPFVAILGGAKVGGKIGAIRGLLPRLRTLIIGGGMANTFLQAAGGSVGASAVDPEDVPLAEAVAAEAAERGCKLVLPVDLTVGERFAADARRGVVAADQVPEGGYALDVGPRTASRFASALRGARTVFWNGPLGRAEWPAFAEGTAHMAQAVAQSAAYTVVGGGDSLAAIRRLGLMDRIDHASTGGGASLEFLEGRVLPGIACLEDAE